MTNDLHSIEVELLEELRKVRGKATLEELSKKVDRIRVLRTASWLEEKGLLKISERSVEKIILTDKGKNAVENGLPERILLNDLKKEKEVSKLTEIEKIGLSQAINSKLVVIKNGKVSLTKEGEKLKNKKLKEEEFLEKINKGLKYLKNNKGIFENLFGRNLIKKTLEKEFNYQLTQEGKSLDLKSSGGITKLSKENVKNWAKYDFKKYNVEAPVKKIYPGKKHPYLNFLNDVRIKLIGMGFKEIRSPIAELEFWNFDALFQPQDHPARNIHDVFELKNPESGKFSKNMEDYVKNVKKMHESGGEGSKGWNYEWNPQKALKLMLRSHNTAASARALAFEKHRKVFTINRVFRPDTIDKKHFIEFYQMEGIVRGDNLNIKNLLGYLELFGKEIAGADEVKFRPSYFPFTEPSVELFIHHPKLGWMEVGGAGIFRPEVTGPFGIKEKVLAWGLGIDRLGMAKLKVNDIRELVFPQNLGYLRRVV